VQCVAGGVAGLPVGTVANGAAAGMSAGCADVDEDAVGLGVAAADGVFPDVPNRKYAPTMIAITTTAEPPMALR
jgi:hypothetical protein